MALFPKEYRRAFIALLLAYIVLIVPPTCFSVTHWFVDQDGKIKQQAESIYNLKSPGDLITFMEQESKMKKLADLQTELLSKRNVLQPSELEKVDIESQMFRTDPDCIISKKRLTEFDLHLSTVMRFQTKKIDLTEHISSFKESKGELRKPYCTTDLPFSMNSYDHLKGVALRNSIDNSSEHGMLTILLKTAPVSNKEEFGDVVSQALEKNQTSWVLLNLAAYYWRVDGPTVNAIECLRRALHYSPRMYKDIALVSLANVLHRAKYSLDAAILMHAALETSSELDIAYLTLGNIYASLGQFDLAELCYKYVVELQPGFEFASDRKHAARCEMKLDKQLEKQHEFLQKTLDDLEDFRHKHQILEEQQKDLLSQKQQPLSKLKDDIQDQVQMKIIEVGKDQD